MFANCKTQQDLGRQFNNYVRLINIVYTVIIVCLIVLAFILQHIPYGFCVIILIPFVYHDRCIRYKSTRIYVLELKKYLPLVPEIVPVDYVPINKHMAVSDLAFFFDDFNPEDGSCSGIHYVKKIPCTVRFDTKEGYITAIHIESCRLTDLTDFLHTNNYLYTEDDTGLKILL